MATQGPNYPGSVTTAGVAPENANDWTNPSNVGADDGSEATITAATYDANDISFRLQCRNLGFTIPAGATIDGVVVEIERRDQNIGNGRDNRVQLTDDTGTLIGDNKASATDWPTNATIETYGSSTDTWNATLTPAIVNDPDFGVTLSVLATAANTDIFVDFVRVTIHYTESTNRKSVVYGFELETPLPNSKGKIYGFEFETPVANRKGLIYGFEFETPLANSKGVVYGFELETPSPNSKALIFAFELETPAVDRKGVIFGFEFEAPLVNSKGLIFCFELETPLSNSKGIVYGFELQVPDVGGASSVVPKRRKVRWW